MKGVIKDPEDTRRCTHCYALDANVFVFPPQRSVHHGGAHGKRSLTPAQDLLFGAHRPLLQACVINGRCWTAVSKVLGCCSHSSLRNDCGTSFDHVFRLVRSGFCGSPDLFKKSLCALRDERMPETSQGRSNHCIYFRLIDGGNSRVKADWSIEFIDPNAAIQSTHPSSRRLRRATILEIGCLGQETSAVDRVERP